MLLFSVCLLMLLEKPLKKYSTVFYILSVLTAVAGYLAQTRMQPGVLRTLLADDLTSGTLPAALFAIVMYAAVLPRKSRIFRCVMSSRGEIAILASLLGLTHMVYYGHLLGQKAGKTSGGMSGRDLAIKVTALLLLLLLVPLTVTSLKKIRRKMNGKRWKKLQRWSYLFYGLLYLHVAASVYPKAVSGNTESLADLSCYTAVFGIYAVLRVEKMLEKKKKQAYHPAVWSLFVVLLTGGAFSVSFHTVQNIRAEEQSVVISEMTVEKAETESGKTDSGSEELPEDQTEEQMEKQSEDTVKYADGTWEGEGMGLNGSVRVSVVVEDGMIAEVKILERVDDDPYFTDARTVLVPAILEKQSADVDTVSGATFSSEGILEAADDALKQAIGNVE